MSGTAGVISFYRGEDPLRADKLNAAFAERVLRSGDTMEGFLTLNAYPVDPMHAATKAYVDATVAVPPSMPLPSDAMPIIEGVASPGVLTTYSRADHVHPATAVPVVRNSARLQAQWINAAVVGNDTVWLCFDMPYAGTVNSLTYFTGNDSFTVAVQINGTNVTGLNAVTVNSATPATTNASGANTFSAGQRITAVISGTVGSPTDALLSLAVTWS